ncbi:MAG: hypothetical protein PF569_09365 [Candidatus Woesearchaeota archaeon]|jgi:hypothetical protein|nr:hypothetical protein [Candidatus Woesearchaeota archaeon]
MSLWSRIFKGRYYFAFLVQFDEHHNPCICGDSIKNLDCVVVEAYTCKKAEEEAFRIIEGRYPNYEGYIQYY